MLLTPVERWERMAQGLFWTGWLFVAFTGYGIYSGDDWRGVVMTAVPGAIVFGLWFLANARADAVAGGHAMPPAARAIGAAVVVGAIAFTIHLIRMAPELEIVERDAPTARVDDRAAFERMLQDVEVVDGKLQRKRPGASGDEPRCVEWAEDPSAPGERHRYCTAWSNGQTLVPEPDPLR